jgi:hypothetical protein
MKAGFLGMWVVFTLLEVLLSNIFLCLNLIEQRQNNVFPYTRMCVCVCLCVRATNTIIN